MLSSFPLSISALEITHWDKMIIPLRLTLTMKQFLDLVIFSFVLKKIFSACCMHGFCFSFMCVCVGVCMSVCVCVCLNKGSPLSPSLRKHLFSV